MAVEGGVGTGALDARSAETEKIGYSSRAALPSSFRMQLQPQVQSSFILTSDVMEDGNY